MKHSIVGAAAKSQEDSCFKVAELCRVEGAEQSSKTLGSSCKDAKLAQEKSEVQKFIESAKKVSAIWCMSW
jgi:hypothetical protein